MAQTADRLSKLQQMLEREPNDSFLLYAIALEHKKALHLKESLEFFDRVIEKDPDYAVAYHQSGLVHEQAGNLEAARDAYRRGIAVASRIGNQHAKEEMQAALMMIE
jgi:tetratricopeptide (TPR) repeat protein